MIDLHCHLLPGIDDGPADLEESLELARLMAAEGVTTAAATPHLREDHPRVVPAELSDRCATLNGHLRSADIDLEVVPGGELDLAWALSASDEDLRLCTYCQRGSDVLVESPYGPLATMFEQLLFQLRSTGLRVLLAHPERNPTFQDDPGRLAELVRQGVLLQLTGASVVRGARGGSRSGQLARALLKDGLAHVIASDAHGPLTAERASLAAGLAAAADIDEATARWMVHDAPAAILRGEPLPTRPALPARRRFPWRRRTAAS
jgi:protein-tyrosine phosphatase